ncbi:hypothetical protein OAT18_00770 [Tenacibaculum sp.]|nr:hypothetical protein [Tenacibaculum sp.]
MNKKITPVLFFLLVVVSLFTNINSYGQEENQVKATYLGIDEMRNTFIFLSEKRSKLSFYKVEETVDIDLKKDKNANKKYLVTWVQKALNYYDADGNITNSQNVRVITGLKEE